LLFVGVGGASNLSGYGPANDRKELYRSPNGMERYGTQRFLAIRDSKFVFFQCKELWELLNFTVYYK
jgi:hypothetical protein